MGKGIYERSEDLRKSMKKNKNLFMVGHTNNKGKSWKELGKKHRGPGKNANKLGRKYNPEYQLALTVKPNTCEVCSIPEKDLTKGLFWDHNHKTGKFRGWLCVRCNSALGHAKDNPNILRELANYLERKKNENG